MRNRALMGIVAGALLAFLPSSGVLAGQGKGDHGKIRHVLLISIDGMHAIDYLNCVSGGYCPNLAALANNGINYINTSTSKRSDSFPSLMTLMTGGTPRTMGVYYDVVFDRALNPPLDTSGNGNLSGICSPGASPSGTTTEYDEGISINKNVLNGGAPSGGGGVNSINPDFLRTR